MSRGHHFTKCMKCLKEFACGDCIPEYCPDCQEKRKRGAERLIQMCARVKVARRLSSQQLGEALKETVWPNLKLESHESALVSEAIERLTKWDGDYDDNRDAWEEVRGLKSQLEAAKEAISAILIEPFGCRFCDSGKLRNPDKAHDDDCGYLIAQRTLAELEAKP